MPNRFGKPFWQIWSGEMVWAKLELGLQGRLFDHNFKMVAGHLLTECWIKKVWKETLGKELCELNKCRRYLRCTQQVVYGSETTIPNLVCTTQSPSQIQSCQQTVLHPDGQWTMATHMERTMATDMERTTSFQQDPSWNHDHRVS
jgi:hypothetical protein